MNDQNIDIEGLANALQETAPPNTGQQGERANVEQAFAEGSRTIMDKITTFTAPQPDTQHEWNVTQPRWKRLFDSKDNRKIWKAINWKERIGENEVTESKDEQFQEYLENILNPPSAGITGNSNTENAPYIPGFRLTERSAEWGLNVDPMASDVSHVRERAAGATKLTTYINEMNPSVTVLQVYQTHQYIKDNTHVSFTRLRLITPLCIIPLLLTEDQHNTS